MATFPSAGQQPYGAMVKTYIDGHSPVEVNALGFGITASNSAAANDTALAAIATAYTGNVLIAFPEVGTYNFSAPLPDRSNLRLKGMGASTVLNWSSGSMLAPSTGSAVTGLHFSDLTLGNSGSASHLVELGSGKGIIYSSFERVTIGPLLTGTSIMHGNGFTNLFGIDFRNCLLLRSASATVSAFDLMSAGGGMNTLTWEGGEIHSNGATGTPFARLESLSASSFCSAISMRNVIGEQNAGGILHTYSANGVIVENVVDHDQSTAYQDDLFKGDTGSGGLQTYGWRINNSGTSGSSTFAGGKYHLNLASGSGHERGRIVNGATSSPLVNVPQSSIQKDFGAIIEAFTTLTTSTTLTRFQRFLLSNGPTLTQTLPDPATVQKGRAFTVKNLHSTTCTVATVAGTIDGASTKTLAQWAVATFRTDGTNWLVF